MSYPSTPQQAKCPQDHGCQEKQSPTARFWLMVAVFLAITMLAGWSWSRAAEPAIVKVEEDWELVVEDPDPNLTAPQICCVISPYADCNCLHASFEINHRNFPSYAAGGLQLQMWQGEENRGYQTHNQQGVLSTPGETVRWTQRMGVTEGQLWVEIDNLSSTTWGNIAGQGSLKQSIAYPHSSLTSYRPESSASRSGVAYAGNRVSSLKLVGVRYYSSQGLVSTDSTERVVHTNSE